MEPMGAVGGATGGMQTIYCSYCSVQLSFPRGSMYIQCPRCQATQNPHAPQQTVCIGCGTLLAHPANSLYIQCPKCMITQNARENRSNVNGQQVPQGGLMGGLNGGDMQSKAPKKKKDPNAPKAASNAYMIFCKERRAELKLENPALAFGKIGARLGEIWRTLTSEEKRPYEERASADRERYRKQMESYKTDGDSVHDPEYENEVGGEDVSTFIQKRSIENLDDEQLGAAFDDVRNKRVKLETEASAQDEHEFGHGDQVGHDHQHSHESPDNGQSDNGAHDHADNPLTDDYNDANLYVHGFGDDRLLDNDKGNDNVKNNNGGFGDLVSAPTPTGGHDHFHNDPNGDDLLEVSSIPGPSVIELDVSGDLCLNVHQDVRGINSESDQLPESPVA